MYLRWHKKALDFHEGDVLSGGHEWQCQLQSERRSDESFLVQVVKAEAAPGTITKLNVRATSVLLGSAQFALKWGVGRVMFVV